MVEGARLESEYTAKPYRGFESLPLRHLNISPCLPMSEKAPYFWTLKAQYKVEAAYRRGNLLEKRRVVMNAWGDYCGGGSAKIVQLVSA